MIVARYEVPGYRYSKTPSRTIFILSRSDQKREGYKNGAGWSKSLPAPEIFVVETELMPPQNLALPRLLRRRRSIDFSDRIFGDTFRVISSTICPRQPKIDAPQSRLLSQRPGICQKSFRFCEYSLVKPMNTGIAHSTGKLC
jgi:hypothetical protein